MSESQVGRADLYDDFVPAFLDFIRHHRGRRTTHQVVNGLDKFFRWLTGNQVSDLQSLTATQIRDFMKTFNNYVDHIAHTPLNEQFKADAWQPERKAA